MKLKMAYYGEPVLRKKARRVEHIDAALHELVRNMVDTMHAHNGIGLAAPQVHQSITLFIMAVPAEEKEGEKLPEPLLQVFINPKILSVSEEGWEHLEGCLSIPKVYGKISRPLHVKVEYTNLEGQRLTGSFSGLEASAVLHENDHLNGVLYIDRMKIKERQTLEPLLKEVKKKYYKK